VSFYDIALQKKKNTLSTGKNDVNLSIQVLFHITDRAIKMHFNIKEGIYGKDKTLNKLLTNSNYIKYKAEYDEIAVVTCITTVW